MPVSAEARLAAQALPDITALDMREEPPERGSWIAPRLAREVFATLDRGEQALLFNRRGYAPLTLCRACGHQFGAPDCNSWLVEHHFRGVLMCHHCGHEQRKPAACPECGAVDALVPIGPGIERIAEEVATRFPRRAPWCSPPIWAPTPSSGSASPRSSAATTIS